jgi:hypothetical protein
VVTEVQSLQNMTTDHFQDLYTANKSVQPNIITGLFEEKVDANMNEVLCAEFTDDEISFALFQIGPTKAPALMDFQPVFIREIGAHLERISLLQ